MTRYVQLSSATLAAAFLLLLFPSWPTNESLMIIAVHLRRTDYARWLANVVNETRFTAARFFLRAMGLALKDLALKEAAFVVASDDAKWCKKTIKNMVHMVLKRPTF